MAPKKTAGPPSRPQPRKKKAFFKRHHAGMALVIVIGWLVPPLAIFIRFGIGIDFFINIILTCLGYIPGHVHNYYCQWIRNNYGRGRTPKWALRAGLIEDNSEYVASTRQWGGKYGERNARNVYDDEHHPEEDEFGNPIEPQGFIENHGIKPAQPGGGFGERGNDLHPSSNGGDLLSGLPDEERDARRAAKRNHKREYGSGLDDQDRLEQERRAAGGESGNFRRSNTDDLTGDLHDPDMYPRNNKREGSGYREEGAFDDHRGSSSRNSGNGGGGGIFGSGSKKSGRAKKSERYGIPEDHAALATNSRSSKSSKRQGSGSERERMPRASNDRYDIVDEDAAGRRRRQQGGGDDEDFLNHQF